MLLTTFNSTACYLLTCDQVWDKSISGEFSKQFAANDSGLSGREGRRAFAASTILTLNYRFFAEGAEAAQIRAALRAYRNEPVLAPFWPGDCLLSDLAACRWAGGLRCFYEEGWGTWQILAGATEPTSFTPSDACRVVPLAWCRFSKLPLPEAADGDESMDCDIAVVENGPAEYAITPTGVTLPAGPVIGALTPRLLSIVADWGASVSSGGIELRIERERIGYGRSEVEEYVDQPGRRRQKVTLPPLGDEIAELVALFAQVGTVGSFWVPGAFAETRLVATSSAGSAVITVADATHLADLTYVALVNDDALAARQITARTGNALTLQSAPGAFAAGTAVCSLLLARFAANKLKITWKTPTVASAAVEVIELPTETIVPAGETIGTTIGDLGAPCWLYVVTDGDLTWRYTSYESAIDAGALGAFEPRPIKQGARTIELNLERHDMELTVGWWEGSPFERIKLDRLAPKLTVQVYRGRIAAPAAAALIFTGTVTGPRFEGGKCTCKLSGMSALFDGRGPVAVTSPRCWAPLYSAPCGLIEAALDAPAQLAGQGSGALFFEPAGGGGWPTTVSDHFRYGYAERTLPDGSKRRHRIVGSSPVITDGYTSPLRTGLVEWWDFPEVGRVPRYGQVSGTALTNALPANIPDSIPADGRRRAPGVLKAYSENHSEVALATADALFDPATTEQISVAFWFRRNMTSAARETIAWFGVGSGGTNSVVRVDQQGAAIIADTFGFIPIGTITPPDPDGWVFVGVAIDKAAAISRLYVNGASVTGATHPFSLGYIGGNRLGVFQNGYGLLDQAAVWSRALSVDDFDAMYNYGLGLTYLDTATPGDQLVVRTLGALDPSPAEYPETGWRLIPGCDKSCARCKALGNAANFRGFPHFPKSNPALIPIKQETPAGGKK